MDVYVNRYMPFDRCGICVVEVARFKLEDKILCYSCIRENPVLLEEFKRVYCKTCKF